MGGLRGGVGGVVIVQVELHCIATDIGNELCVSAQQCFLQNNPPAQSRRLGEL